MALTIADRVLQTGSANTTVSFTLSGSVSGYQSFSFVWHLVNAVKELSAQVTALQTKVGI